MRGFARIFMNTAAKTRAFSAALALALSCAEPKASAEEGLWLPEQLGELSRTLSSRGFELDAKDLWSDTGGLMRAAVNLSGCSAAFVSSSGLVATNYHCALRAVSTQSSVEHDFLKQGFLAKKPADELEAKGYTLEIVESIRDVTREVLGGTSGVADDRARWAAIETAQKKLVLECERPDPSLRCDVQSLYMGSEFRLFRKREIRELRLVYAPPAGVGDYGGEVDNWTWPRHTGDFALLRAYVAEDGKSAEHSPRNVPYKPRFWLKLGRDGIHPGDFVAVLGYPGVTRRQLTSAGVERFVSHSLPATVSLLSEWLEAIDEVSKTSAGLPIKLASQRKAIANRLKNAQGTLERLRQVNFVDRRRREEQRMAEYGAGKGHEAAAAALRALTELGKARLEHADREFLLDQTSAGPPLLAVAIDLVRRAREREKPDLEREPQYMDRNGALLWKLEERRLRDFVPEAEAELLSSLVTAAEKLPENARIGALHKLAGPSSERARLARTLLPRIRASGLGSVELAKTLFDSGKASELAHSTDPLLILAEELVPDLEALENARKAERGLEARAASAYFEALKAVRGGPIYADANGTLRLSYARVMGYEPRDGVLARPQTTLEGAMQKHTGLVPFDLPKGVRERAAAAKTSPWADTHLGDVPVCFLSNADTTGGNSGSPVINGKGELVGLNFDRVWENVANDFGYSPERSRNIAVDIRYLLWMLDRVENATGLLKELGITESRTAAGRAPLANRKKPSTDSQDLEPPPKPRCGCRAAGQPAGDWSGVVAGLLGLFAASRLRARAGHERAV